MTKSKTPEYPTVVFVRYAHEAVSDIYDLSITEDCIFKDDQAYLRLYGGAGEKVANLKMAYAAKEAEKDLDEGSKRDDEFFKAAENLARALFGES